MDTTAPTAFNILKRTFSYVSDLQTYLEALLGAPLVVHRNDGETLASLLATSLVAADGNPYPISTGLPPTTYCSQAELVNRARARLFTNKKEKSSNVLNLGFRMADSRGEAHRGGLSNFFTNTTADLVQTREWQILLERVGEDAMFQLLTTTSVFVSLPNDCWCQILGRPISEVFNGVHPAEMAVPLSLQQSWTSSNHRSVPSGDDREYNQLSLQPDNGRGRKRRAGQVSLVRARIFYAKASRSLRGSIRTGLPTLHILNRLRADIITPAMARHLLKYIFPSQYKLHNVFTSDRDGAASVFPFQDYTMREEEIRARGPCKTPERLTEALILAGRLLIMHRRCNFRRLCDRICPSKVQGVKSTLSDSSIILEMMSEITQTHTQDETTSGDVSHCSAMIPHGASAARAVLKAKPRFTEFICSHSEVFRFASAAIMAVIPRAFWGADANLRHVLRTVWTLIRARRFETTNLHLVIQGFRIMDCDWLAPTGRQARAQRQGPADFTKRRELVEEFLYWVFDSFLFPLLKTTFYVTDSSAYRNRVLYFRQDDWDFVCRPLLDRLARSNFVVLPKEDVPELMKNRHLGFSFIRLLPKETGVRPIVNLRRRAMKTAAPRSAQLPSSINHILQAAFQILTLEKNRNPDLLGASVLGLNEIYEKLKVYKLRLEGNHGPRPPLFFVKVDVRSCFDTIDQVKLLEILRHVVKEDGYMIQKYAQVIPAAGRMKRSYMKRACPDSEHPSFLSLAMKLAASLRHALFVDQVVYPFEDREDVLELLKEHVMENVVKIGEDFYRQTVGIPQGSVLSTILCSFFYGDLERTKLSFVRNPHCLLLRYIDDFLLITTDKTQAVCFLHTMNRGHPDYGCFIAKEKTRTNFASQNVELETHELADFPWCGLTINTKTLAVKPDYARYKDAHMRDTLTVDRRKKAGIVFRYKLFQSVKQRSHIIFNDTSLSSFYVVHLNMYQSFLVSAMKMHCYIRGWHSNVNCRPGFILEAIKDTVRFAYFAARNKGRGQLAVDNGATCLLKLSSIMWLGMHAFHHVLTKRASAYRVVLHGLARELVNPRYATDKRRMAAVTKEGMHSLESVTF